jgi:uncharacterized membrane protein HdeD (DUF308 family)
MNSESVFQRWWLLAVRGAVAIVFGVLTFVAPMASLLALVIMFGVFALADGALHLVLAFQMARRGERWGSLMVAGIAGLAAGLVTLVWPAIGGLALLFVIAFWAMATGIAAIFAAVRLRRHIRGEWLMATSGALSVVFGVLLVIFPGPGALAVALWIGAYAIVFGAILIALGLRLRTLRPAGRPAPAAPLPTPTAA